MFDVIITSDNQVLASIRENPCPEEGTRLKRVPFVDVFDAKEGLIVVVWWL